MVYPSRAAERIILRENFRNAADVVRNGGTLAGSPVVKDGIILDGATQSVSYSTTGGRLAVPELSVVMEFSPGFAYDETAVRSFMVLDGAASSSILRWNSGAQFRIAWAAGAFYATIPGWTIGERQRLVVSWKSGDSKCWFNGTLLQTDADALTPQQGDTLEFGTGYAGSYFEGEFHSISLYARALTDLDVEKLEAGRLWSYPNEATLWLDMKEQTAREAFVRDHSEQLTDGDMEAADISAWPSWAGTATVSKDTVSPYAGARCLKLVNLGAGTYGTRQDALTVGQRVRCIGYAESDGTDSPQLIQGGVVQWQGVTGAGWQKFDVTFNVAVDGYLYLRSDGAGGVGGYVRYDEISVVRTDELLNDGDMEATGIDEWTAGASATLTKEGDAYEGSQCLRVAYNGVNFPFAVQYRLTTGSMYHVTGRMRGDGNTGFPHIRIGTTYGTAGTTSNEWQEIDDIVIANSTDFRLYQFTTGPGYAEFDNISVREIKQCTLDKSPAGYVALLGTGSLSNAAAPDFKAPGFEFDGSNDVIVLSEAEDIYGASEVSIAVKIKPQFTPGDGNYRVVFDSSDGNRYALFLINDGRLRLYLNDVSIATINLVDYERYWLRNGWNVFVVSGTSANTSLWLNGNVIIDADPSPWTPGNPAVLYLGQSFAGSYETEGVYDHFSAYKTRLSPMQVDDLMHSLGVTPWA